MCCCVAVYECRVPGSWFATPFDKGRTSRRISNTTHAHLAIQQKPINNSSVGGDDERSMDNSRGMSPSLWRVRCIFHLPRILGKLSEREQDDNCLARTKPSSRHDVWKVQWNSWQENSWNDFSWKMYYIELRLPMKLPSIHCSPVDPLTQSTQSLSKSVAPAVFFFFFSFIIHACFPSFYSCLFFISYLFFVSCLLRPRPGTLTEECRNLEVYANTSTYQMQRNRHFKMIFPRVPSATSCKIYLFHIWLNLHKRPIIRYSDNL